MEKTSGSEIWGITSFFNPLGHSNKYENYKRFRQQSKNQGLNLVCVELAFDDRPFEINEDDAEIIVRIKGGDENVLWQKERLLNIALKHLPEECTKVIWLDCDILFNNSKWIQKTSEALDKFKIIQPFENVIRLNKNRTSLHDSAINDLDFGNDEMMKSEGLISAKKTKCSRGHPGYVWAGRRDILEKHHFYDRTIISNADSLMGYAFTNDSYYEYYFEAIGCEVLYDDYSKWYEKISEDVNNEVHYISGNILHMWHGDVRNRKYDFLLDILNSYSFNPRTDIKINDDLIWTWTKRNPGLQRAISNYFGMRNETNRTTLHDFLKRMVLQHMSVKFNWKRYIRGRPDLKRNWNGPIRAWLHYFILSNFDFESSHFSALFSKYLKYVVLTDISDEDDAPLTEALPLFLYLRDKGVKNCYYLINKNNEAYDEIRKLENVVCYNDSLFSKSTYLLLRAKLFFFSFKTPRFVNLETFTIFLDHGIPIFKYSIYKDGNYQDLTYDKMIISSSLGEKFLIKAGRNKQDLLPFGLVRFTEFGWNYNHRNTKPEKGKSILFFPTYRFGDHKNTSYIDYIKSCVGTIKRTLKEHNLEKKIRIKVCLHHCLKNKGEFSFLEKDSNVIYIKPSDLTKNIITSELLVTDFSSVCFDFMKQRKPIIFFRENITKGYSLVDENNLSKLKNSDRYFFNICYDERKFERLLTRYISNDFVLEQIHINKTQVFFDCCKDIDEYKKFIESVTRAK